MMIFINKGRPISHSLLKSVIIIITIFALLLVSIATSLLGDSLADIFVEHCSGGMVFLVYITLHSIYLYLQLAHTFLPNIVLRFQSRKKIWLNQLFFILKSSALFTVYYTVIISIIGSLYANSVFNWNLVNSSYYFATNSVFNENSMPVVFIAFIFSCFLALAFNGVLFLFFWWRQEHPLVGWVLIYFQFVLDLVANKILLLYNLHPLSLGFIFKRTSIIYSSWHDKTVFPNLLIVLIASLILAFYGYRISNKKEFLHAIFTSD